MASRRSSLSRFTAGLREFEQELPAIVSAARSTVGAVREVVKEVVLLAITVYGFLRLLGFALSPPPP